VPALLLLASVAATIAAATPDEQPAVARPVPALVEEVVVSAPEPRYVAPTTRDRIGRIWAPVLINGQGPYRLVLDTGASRSAVTRAVAEELRVPIRRDAVKLRGATGSATVDAVRVDTLEVGDLLIDGTTLPIVGDAFGGAQGVLGGEGLGDKRIVIEFRKDRISIRRSNRERAPAGYSVVPFRFGTHHGMRIEVTVGRLKAVGLIDTGAQVTVGNSALREALMRRRPDDLAPTEDIVGVTEDVQQADTLRIPGIVAGELIVRHAPIKFSDLAIFEYWKLDREPALLIGMDVLGVLDTLVIDYRLRELQVRTR
jgi:hypothetical protein